ncbi:bcs1-like protein [Grosmannia clavigera kw1407]|uniref:Bcs1-like protein n=1 Tax=Grosmannia clavigera (strain kw1407 / UAMH 11150) TaxID=655863 RepID=F0X9H2_GROCL|nr:bcs1-like protein [Grosmannia clavigera kw1407]EFX05221.1 bcs1-like protein [Grosmannia clavigera kw1407]
MVLNGSCSPLAEPIALSSEAAAPASAALLDFFFPGLSMFTGALQRHLHIDLSHYFLPIMFLSCATVVWKYLSSYLYTHIEAHLMSTVEVRYDDEVYNMLMNWVTCQPFAQNARHFIVNTVVGSRSWSVWELRYEEQRRGRNDDSETESDDGDDEAAAAASGNMKAQKKALSYTPNFGTYYFWFQGHIISFRRTQNRDSAPTGTDQRESVSLTCLGRNPAVLKELLLETRRQYLQRDMHKTVIYRGSDNGGKHNTDCATWVRCMARNTRPMSTVILNDKIKKDLVADVTDYLDPATRRWYANRGIPYRRGYLLYGPPGTGKSSLSVSLAGFFRMNIYIVSLNGSAATEENLSTLFNNLPRRCIVLLEDIDTAGLTHTREDGNADKENESDSSDSDDDSGKSKSKSEDQSKKGSKDEDKSDKKSTTPKKDQKGRLSLSGLLNILDGVASQEGRILIMTTNHIEKLDKALIRPGRVDMAVKFDLADRDMIAALFRSIFAPLEGETVQAKKGSEKEQVVGHVLDEMKRAVASTEKLAKEFAEIVPELTFSPAELQGFLLRHKRDPVGAVADVGTWVEETKEAKARLTKREEKKAERERVKEEAKKAKKEEEEKKSRAAKRAAIRTKASKKASKDDGDSSSSSSSDADSEARRSRRKTKQRRERKTEAEKTGSKSANQPCSPGTSLSSDLSSEDDHRFNCSSGSSNGSSAPSEHMTDTAPSDREVTEKVAASATETVAVIVS